MKFNFRKHSRKGIIRIAVRIDAWTDFVCPFCFLVTCTLEKLQKEGDLVIHWHAFLLRPLAYNEFLTTLTPISLDKFYP